MDCDRLIVSSVSWLLVGFAGCGGSSSPAQSDQPGAGTTPESQSPTFEIASIAPPMGSSLSIGTSYSISYRIGFQRQTTACFLLAATRDTLHRVLAGYGGTGSHMEASLQGPLLITDPLYEFAKGHTVNAVVVGAASSDPSCDPAVTYSEAFWEQATYRFDVPLNWTVLDAGSSGDATERTPDWR